MSRISKGIGDQECHVTYVFGIIHGFASVTHFTRLTSGRGLLHNSIGESCPIV
jgi:hypothetical protein